jgi:hypothetical protein
MKRSARWARVPAVKDVILMAALAVGLATLVTTHVALAGRIFLRQRPRWRGLVAFVVPPLALLWAVRAGWRVMAAIWVGSIAIYLVALIAALAGART